MMVIWLVVFISSEIEKKIEQSETVTVHMTVDPRTKMLISPDLMSHSSGS